jgi:hypothetical protein
MISAKFSCGILMIDSYFPHAMKMCTIQGSPKVHLFLSGFLLLEILLREMFLIKMVKLTTCYLNLEPKNSSILSRLQHKLESSSNSSVFCAI